LEERRGAEGRYRRPRGRIDELCKRIDVLREEVSSIHEEISEIKYLSGFLKGKTALWGALGGAIVAALVQIALAVVKG